MILLAPAALCLALALALGGQLSRLATIPLVPLAIVACGFGLQLVAMSLGDRGIVDSLSYRLLLMSGMGLVLAGFLGARRLPFASVALAGLALNLIVMVGNGGTMVAAQPPANEGFTVVAPRGEARIWGSKAVVRSPDQTVLPWLGDVLPIDVGAFHRVLSIGDVVLALGVGLMLAGAMLSNHGSSLAATSSSVNGL